MYKNHKHFHQGDAGLDVYIVENQIINSEETTRIKLGISCENIDRKAYFLMPRSSISKTPLRLANSVGLIDAGYRGEIMVTFNLKNPWSDIYNVGDRIAQLVIIPVPLVQYKEVEELSETQRGTAGHGSTGV